MLQEGSVFIGRYDTTFIFKIEGRLTQKSLWNTNAAIQKCMDDQTITDLLVDITYCTYMDSTILGSLARWAISFARTHNGLPFLIGLQGNPLESTFRRMNLHTLFHVSKDSQVSEKSALLQLSQTQQQYSKQEYAEYLLSAHQTLTELSAENAKEFASVIQCLKVELQANKNP
jgi:anti-anti-sigma regulatory factor